MSVVDVPAGQHVVTRGGVRTRRKGAEADLVTTEVIRHALNSAANQMKRVLVRTAFSPAIFEVLDFAVGLYDRECRMLAQAPSLPMFMGTLSFCIEEAVRGVGGEAELEPGDVLLYNNPFGAGSHQNDAALIMPVFDGQNVMGYAVIKAHWLDVAGKEPYSTDTTDVFQEGIIFPGVKLYRRGKRVDDVYRIILANTRVPKAVVGDMSAQVAAVRLGAHGLERVFRRYGSDVFAACVEQMYDHGEAVVRRYFEQIPDGTYTAEGCMDSDGVTEEPIPFLVRVEVIGSDVRIDLTDAPDSRPGPINSPLPRTVSGCRVAISMLAGADEPPNEGHFRPLEIETRAGSLFHPLSPAPVFLGGRPALHLIEVIYRALANAMPGAVPACSGADSCTLVWWGTREQTGDPWADGCAHPVGQGAHARADGGTCMHMAMSATRLTPAEVWEARNPWLIEKIEFAQDSGGAGRYQGGLGIDLFFRMREDTRLTSALERAKSPPWGLDGGLEGRANATLVRDANGERINRTKTTGALVAKGSTVELYCGGGGGYGPPSERAPDLVHADLRDGRISEAFARRHYPGAFDGATS